MKEMNVKRNILFPGQIISATFERKCGSKATASVAEYKKII